MRSSSLHERETCQNNQRTRKDLNYPKHVRRKQPRHGRWGRCKLVMPERRVCGMSGRIYLDLIVSWSRISTSYISSRSNKIPLRFRRTSEQCNRAVQPLRRVTHNDWWLEVGKVPVHSATIISTSYKATCSSDERTLPPCSKCIYLGI